MMPRLLSILTIFALNLLPLATAEELEVRQFRGGILRFESESGLDLIILPNESAKVPDDLQKVRSFTLGDETQPLILDWKGNESKEGIRIAPEKIGSKLAAIRLKSADLNILAVHLSTMSAQGFIRSGPTDRLDLLVLTVDNEKLLRNGRTNLWMGRNECRQIALNAVTSLTKGETERFHKSLKRKRTLPTAVIPMTEVPFEGLEFGDQATIQLKQLD